jgi:HEAT repeat protein
MNDKLLRKIRKMATDFDWTIRESAASEIKIVNDKHFRKYLPIWRKWVKDPDPNIRRAIEVGLLRINKKYYQEAFELLVPLLHDNDKYVRKNCGPFSLSAVASRNPVMKEENQNVRWNIAMCLGVMFGVKYPKQSIKLLKVLAKDSQKFVWRASASSLIKLLRKFPEYKKDIYSWRNVDHVLDVIKKYIEK